LNKNLEKVSLRSNYDQKQAELNDLMDWLEDQDELPDVVSEAVSIQQDILTHDIAAIRERIMQIEGVE
jgi:hypothetical protein